MPNRNLYYRFGQTNMSEFNTFLEHLLHAFTTYYIYYSYVVFFEMYSSFRLLLF